MIPPKHWQDPVNACVGVAMLISPWLAGYAFVQPALANAVIVGAVLFTVSVSAAVIGRPWVDVALLALGVWMVCSPWALDFTEERSIGVVVVLGIAVVLLAAGALAADLRQRLRIARDKARGEPPQARR